MWLDLTWRYLYLLVISWGHNLCHRLQLRTGMDLSKSLFELLGYCSDTNRVRIGSLAENTHPQIKEEIHDMVSGSRQGGKHLWGKQDSKKYLCLKTNSPINYS